MLQKPAQSAPEISTARRTINGVVERPHSVIVCLVSVMTDVLMGPGAMRTQLAKKGIAMQSGTLDRVSNAIKNATVTTTTSATSRLRSVAGSEIRLQMDASSVVVPKRERIIKIAMKMPSAGLDIVAMFGRGGTAASTMVAAAMALAGIQRQSAL